MTKYMTEYILAAIDMATTRHSEELYLLEQLEKVVLESSYEPSIKHKYQDMILEEAEDIINRLENEVCD